MSFLSEKQRDLAKLKDTQQWLRTARATAALAGVMENGDAWKALVSELGKWAERYKAQLLTSECPPYEQGFGQGVMRVVDFLVSGPSSQLAAIEAKLLSVDAAIERHYKQSLPLNETVSP